MYGKMLNTGIEVQNQCHLHVSMLLVQATAHSVYEDLSESDDNVQPFSASTGCFSRFTKRYRFHNIKMIGEAASASVTVTHYMRLSTPNPQEVHCFKWKFCVQFMWIFQKCNPGIKQDLTVYLLSKNSAAGTLHKQIQSYT
jgi:Tc5 transposase DNA-binding domain.